jgi:hypothetical protein
MTDPRDPDSGLEELLRSALRGEGDGVLPAGDGLARIQERIATRRGRRRWFVPIAAVGTAAVAAAAGFTAYALSTPPNDNDSISSQPGPTNATSFSTSPTPTPTETQATAPAYPDSAFYPFSSAAQEQSWEAQGGPSAQAWMTDAVATAKHFVSDFVLEPDVTTVMAKQKSSSAASVTLGRTMHDGNAARPLKVTTVRLERYGKAWLVVGADDPNGYLTTTSPASGSTISDPVTVSGPAFGVEESVQVDIRAVGAPFLTAKHSQVMFGNGSAPWSTTVSYAAPGDPRGAVVLTEASMADGGPQRIVATGVAFDSTAGGYPAYFYAVKNARITKFSARTGAAISYLTRQEPGGGPSDPQLVGDRVYYLSGSGTCANVVASVPTSGGTSRIIAAPQPGYVISSFAVSGDATKVATFETACADAATPQGLLVTADVGKPQPHIVPFPAFPPMVTGDPSWEPDGRYLDAVVRTGNQAHAARFDAFAAKDLQDSSPSCDTMTGLPQTLEVDSVGGLWSIAQDGDSAQVVRCLGGVTRVMFTVATSTPVDIDVAGSGSAVLVTDADGHVWRWTQGGSVVQLKPSVPITQLTW